MRKHEGSCPMDAQQVVDAYFLQNRARLLDIAAFLDRIDRASNRRKKPDYRIEVFYDGIRLLAEASANRVEQLQKLLSDPRFEPKERVGGPAVGAVDRKKVEE